MTLPFPQSSQFSYSDEEACSIADSCSLEGLVLNVASGQEVKNRKWMVRKLDMFICLEKVADFAVPTVVAYLSFQMLSG